MESTWREEYKKIKEREERFQTGETLQLNDPEERVKQKSRMERFKGEDKDVEYWEKYVEPVGTVKKDTIYMYGVDYLSTEKILEYFEYFRPVRVEWLNDTSCNVVFPSEDNALQAINTSCMEKIEDFSEFENVKRTAIGYQIKDEDIPIYMRFSSEADVKSEDVKAENSKFYKWKKKLDSELKNKAIGKRRKERKNRY